MGNSSSSTAGPPLSERLVATSKGFKTGADAVNTMVTSTGSVAANTLSTAGSTVQHGHDLYQNTLKVTRGGDDDDGGDGDGGGASYFDGGGEAAKDKLLDDLKEYRSSESAKFKEGIVRAVARTMKAQGFEVDPEADLDTVSSALHAKIRGHKFGTDAGKHEKVCKALAETLNNQITPGRSPGQSLIDTSAGAKSICRSISEIIQGLTSGMQAEFLTVQAQVQHALRQLAVLHELMRVTQAKLVNDLTADASTEARRATDPMRDAYDRLRQHHDQVMQTLQGLLDSVILPASKELELSMAEQDELYQALRKKDLVPGTGEFGRHLGAILDGLSVMSGAAARTQKALSVVGSSMAQYANSAEWNEFREGLNSPAIKDPAMATEVATAIEQLRAAFPMRKDIMRDADSDIARLGGADDEPSELDRRIKRRKLERQVILKQYFERTRAQYDKLLAAVKAVGPQLGRTIPITTSVKSLRDALERMANASDVRVDFNLIGYYSSADSRTKRDAFFDHLALIDRSLDELVSGPGGAQFAQMREAIKGVKDTIEYYTEVVKTKFGGAAGATGGDDEPVEDELKLAESARSSLDLNSAIRTFVYFIYVAGVRENLKISAKEVDEYGARYDEILGDAVAGAQQALIAERTRLLDETGAPPASIGPKPAAAAELAEWTAAKNTIELEYKTKHEFYEVLQAVDLYMKAFASGIAQHPDDIADIKSELDGVEIIGRWYIEGTGDALYRFFEQGTPFGATLDAPAQNGINVSATGAHYYDRVQEALQKGDEVAGVGAAPASRAVDMRKHMHAALHKLQSLKNLINAFARIGAKFGGEPLRTFMSPTEMWQKLLQYMEVSAISRGADAGAPAEVAGQQVVQTADAARAFRSCYPTPVDDNGALKSNWKQENMFFQFIIKAIAAKILVVLGTYDLFERPEPIFDLTPTRMILGGAYGAAPEVIPGATELYFRLPRLAEFYRDLFDFSDAADKKISMIPEMGGVFGPLIAQVFIKSESSAKDGNYSESDVEGIVSAINTVYDKYKEHGAECCTRAIHGFVAEINRRYAIIKKEDYDKYMKTYVQESRYENQSRFADDGTNFAILPGEEAGSLSQGLRSGQAPSARFLGPSGAGTAGVKYAPGKYALDKSPKATAEMWGFLSGFRDKLMKKLHSEGTRKAYGRVSYSAVIEQARKGIEATADKRARMEIVLRIVQGSELVSGTDQGRALIFHETVVLGLNALTAIYEQLKAFTDQVGELNVVEKVFKSLESSGIVPAATKYTTADNTEFHLDATNKYYRGLIASGDTPNTMTAALVALAGRVADPTNKSKAYRIITRYVVDRQAVMRDAFLAIYQLASDFDNLVGVRFPGAENSKLHLDFSNLRTLIESLMDNVRYFMNQFRGSFDADTIKRYEGGDTTDYGTLRFLESKLIDGFVKGQVNIGGAAVGDDMTFERISRAVNSIIVELTKKHDGFAAKIGAVYDIFDKTGVSLTGAAAAPAVDETDDLFDHYGRAFSSITFWDAAKDNSGVLLTNTGVSFQSVPMNQSNFDLSGLVRGPRPVGVANPQLQMLNSRISPPAPAAGALPVGELTHVHKLYDYNGRLRNRSMLFALNQTMAQYISQYYDAPSGKIYQGLIDAFANGAFSQAIIDRQYTMPDITAGAVAFGRRGDPNGQSVLATSIAMVLQRITRDQISGVSEHLYSTLSEVPTYMKESIRGTLPIFNKMFMLLLKEGEFMKEFIDRTKVKCGRPALNIGAAAAGGTPKVIPEIIFQNYDYVVDYTTIYPLGAVPNNTHDIVKTRILDVVSSINNAAFAMSRIAGEVLNEMGTAPLYFETSDGSIQAYRSRYSKMPLMPESLITHLLVEPGVPAAAVNVAMSNTLTPTHAVNSPKFQIMYAVRGLFAPMGKTGLDQMPGVKDILTAYNAGAAQREKADEARFAALASDVAVAVRYIVNTRGYRAALVSSAGSFTSKALFGTGLPGVYTLRDPAKAMNDDQILSIVDSSYQEDKVADITKDLREANGMREGDLGQRETERINNIIDMNIMPINVHALMRSMALASTYNYAYTCEELFATFMRESREAVSGLNVGPGGPGGPPKDTKQFFLKLLIDPYAKVSQSIYGDETNMRGTHGFGNRMFRGDNGLGMGRPKFLSDQVFNKALFGSIWLSKRDYDEMGPNGATSRGRDGWGGKAGTLSAPAPGALNAAEQTQFNAIMQHGQSLVSFTDSFDPYIDNANRQKFSASFADITNDITAINGNANWAPHDVAANSIINALKPYNDKLLDSAGAGGAAGTTGLFKIVEDLSDDAAPDDAAMKSYVNTTFTSADKISEIITKYNSGVADANIMNTANKIDARALLVALGVDIPATTPGRANLNTYKNALKTPLVKYLMKNHAEVVKIINPFATKLVDKYKEFNKTVQPLGFGTARVITAPTDQNMGGVSINTKQDPERSILTYIDSTGKKGMEDIKEISVGFVNKQKLQQIGLDRFNTAPVRNMLLIANVNRMLRSKMSHELAEQRTILQRGSDLHVAPGLTEYEYDETSTTRQYFSERDIV